MKTIAKTELEKSLSILCFNITENYVNETKRVIDDKSIDASEKRNIIIGEGNHRIVAEKI